MTTAIKPLPTFTSLRACKKVLKAAIGSYKRLSKRLSSTLINELESAIDKLQNALEAKDLAQSATCAQEVERFLQEHGRKTPFEHVKEFIIAVVVALLIAGVIRQTWFEPYEIPTGSMRPTFKEKDGVFALKNTFGINIPFQTSHLLFDPDLVKRGSIVIITGDELGFTDVDTTYFGLFPGKRRYVKRCVAKGGDTIYFYGGKIYGIDKDGNPIEETVPLEHIPFISFEGKMEQSAPSAREKTFTFSHMDIPIGKINITSTGAITSQIPTPHGWRPESLTQGTFPQAFFQFWGIQNFALSKLVTESELPAEAAPYKNADAKLYLELIHTPTLASRRKNSNTLLNTKRTWIALDNDHCVALKEALYTARFIVRDGTAFHYTPEGSTSQMKGVFLDKAIPDGCYEFFDGVAYQIGWGGISYKLDPSHPIYPQATGALKNLYNYGIELYPLSRNNYPSRYTYFRDGDLYTLGKKIFDKKDHALSDFAAEELGRKTRQADYIAFVDHEAPDAKFIKAFGLKIPEGHYLLLGDNHAQSNDSRFIGAVPEKNIQGSPVVIFWPPGDRWGSINQPAVPFLRASNILILAIVGIIGSFCYVIHRKRLTYRYFCTIRKPSARQQ